MKTLVWTIFLLAFVVLTACNQNLTNLIPPDPIIGYWINPVYDGQQITLEKADDFNEEGYGIAFFEDESVIERGSGWCGTPPLTFSNLDGTWSLTDSILDIEILHHWMGDIQWDIVSLDDNILVVKWL